jgi:hypothetical protein
MVSLLEGAGLTKNPQGERGVDSFTVIENYRGLKIGSEVAKDELEAGRFTVEITALIIRPNERGSTPRVNNYSYRFIKKPAANLRIESEIECISNREIMIGFPLSWQSGEGAPPPRVSYGKRFELAQKMIEMCGEVLPPGRKAIRPER